MDKDDIIYGERILEILKGKPRIISDRLYEKVHYEFKGQPRKQLQNYDHILKALENLGLIETDYLGANRKQIFLLEKGKNAKSYQCELANAKAAQRLKGKKERLELENIERQVWAAKNWHWIAAVTAMITALVTRYFSQCP